LIIVDVLASTEAFVGTVCLIAVRCSVSKLSSEWRLDRPFQRRFQSRTKRQQ